MKTEPKVLLYQAEGDDDECEGLTKRDMAEMLAAELGMRLTKVPAKWRFKYGIGFTVTVSAVTCEQAAMKARGVLDKRYEKAGKEPPVAWSLCLIEGPK